MGRTLETKSIALPYEESIASYSSAQEEAVSPSCVVLPESAEDVAVVVATLGNSRGHVGNHDGCQFAVRSGGHTPWAGAANIEGGVTIDLGDFNQVEVSSDRSTVTIGPGSSWRDVYNVVIPRGLATGGGGIANVGVGGLVLGGGIYFFSPRKGFVCDGVKRFEVVLASGRIVNATQHSNHDLWLALKGGSNNFGIYFDQQFAAFEAFTGNPDYDPYASRIHSMIDNFTTKSWFTIAQLEYTQPEAYPPDFENFTSLPTTFSTTRMSNLTDFTEELDVSTPPGQRQMFVTSTYSNSAEMLKQIFLMVNETVRQMEDVAGLLFILSSQPEPMIIQKASAEAGGNSLGLSVEHGSLFNFQWTLTWDDAEDDDFVEQQVRDAYNKAEHKAQKLGVQQKFIYLNYAAPWQDPIGGYGEDVVRRLREVSRKYDPTDVFQKQVPGGFKLFN
ncbi:hypothetical protein KC340_g7176 [Hortaea werneckii]|nr:hypothetical protein KC342_g6138 [Hortaea werneckii]KAI7099511.1 hypothetical protein KC339_g8141 [Hortaea werneckii]KAI7230315.1 hypothetical protein KC365_g7678 [Hortaea werneckii]KAI7322036.1 hypothetical protein KC340_g7176 [Hortaea werneckii]KAI7383080.1 hypothetical protein KC328_g11451 [Hortaea werneckii]